MEVHQVKKGTKVEDIIAAFPQGVTLMMHTVFPGEYRIGYRFKNRLYSPGSPSYYSLEEALLRCYAAFCDSEGEKGAAEEILSTLEESDESA